MTTMPAEVRARPAEILREYGPFADGEVVHGVTFDGTRLWYAAGDRLQSVDVEHGRAGAFFAVPARAGTAFDGTHFWQIADGRIRKIDARTGEVVHTIPAPSEDDNSGLTWAEGSLWIGQYRDRCILRLDPETGRVLKRIASTRFVTGVTFAEGELWHGVWDDEGSEVRRVDGDTGAVLERLAMPADVTVTGLEADGGERLFCGGGRSGKIRAIRRPRR